MQRRLFAAKHERSESARNVDQGCTWGEVRRDCAHCCVKADDRSQQGVVHVQTHSRTTDGSELSQKAIRRAAIMAAKTAPASPFFTPDPSWWMPFYDENIRVEKRHVKEMRAPVERRSAPLYRRRGANLPPGVGVEATALAEDCDSSRTKAFSMPRRQTSVTSSSWRRMVTGASRRAGWSAARRTKCSPTRNSGSGR